MVPKPVLQSWILALLVGIAVSALAYLLASPGFGNHPRSAFAWCLWPGVALYAWLNGSLLFGGGFGGIGNAAIIILGSAATWSVPLTILLQGFLRFRRNHRHH